MPTSRRTDCRNTVEDLFKDLMEVFKRFRACNMTIKPSKLIICPKKTFLLGWEYSNQAWRPSAHKLNPLASAPEPSTVKQLRSWWGASKQLSPGLPSYAEIFQPQEKMAVGRGSNKKLVWTEQSSRHFKAAKFKTRNFSVALTGRYQMLRALKVYQVC